MEFWPSVRVYATTGTATTKEKTNTPPNSMSSGNLTYGKQTLQLPALQTPEKKVKQFQNKRTQMHTQNGRQDRRGQGRLTREGIPEQFSFLVKVSSK